MCPARRQSQTVRADQTPAVRADECKQPLLSIPAFGADLGEAGGHDTDGADTGSQSVFSRIENGVRRHADQRELDRDLESAKRASTRHACDRVPRAVDRVRRTLEATSEDVPEELTADRSAASRGAVDGDARGVEEMGQ